jgi:hypothetical protein
LAEGWARRYYERSFIAKLVEADGEQMETQHWLDVAVDCGCIQPSVRSSLVMRCEEIGRLIGGMLAKASQFSRPDQMYLKESVSEYVVNSDSPFPSEEGASLHSDDSASHAEDRRLNTDH